MSRRNRWLIKTHGGKIHGPLSTAQVMELIRQSELSGEEEISKYPGGDWFVMSSDPEFFDQLLSSLSDDPSAWDEENEKTQPMDASALESLNGDDEASLSGVSSTGSSTGWSQSIPADFSPAGILARAEKEGRSHASLSNQKSVSEKNSDLGRAENTNSVTVTLHRDAQGDISSDGETEPDPDPEKTFVGVESAQPKVEPRLRGVKKEAKKYKNKEAKDYIYKENPVIELTNRNKASQKIKIQKVIRPLLFVIFTVVVAGLYLKMQTGDEQQTRIHLSGPNFLVKKQVSDEEVKKSLQRAEVYFLRDTFKNYLRVQSEALNVIPARHRNLEAYSLLCKSYFELWPYTYQDAHDLKIISQVSQQASSVDPTSLGAQECRVLFLYVNNKILEAKNLVEAVLKKYNFSEEPPLSFYYFKALLLERSGDFTSALGYITSAQKLNPRWLRPYVIEARLQTQLNHYSEAGERYRQILKVNPQHKVAMISLGVIEYKYLFHYEKAKEHFLMALKNKEWAPRRLMAEAYLGLAEVSVYAGHKSEGLEYAQKAYELSPSNVRAKNIIVKLGGTQTLEHTQVKGSQLVYEGDIFLREGNCDAAQAHYKAAYKLNPKNGVAAMKAGKCLWSLSFSTQAIEWLNKAIRAEPKLIEAYTTLADYYTQKFNYFGAASVLAKAKRMSPQSFEVYRGYALVELRRKNYQGAVSFAQKALSYYDSDIGSLVILSEAYLELGKYNEAYSSALKAVDVDDSDRPAQMAFAKALAGLKGAETGASYMQDKVSEYPMVPEFRLALAEIYKRDERYQSAEEILRQVIRLDAKPKMALIELGEVLKLENRPQEARDTFMQAAFLDPADSQPLFEAAKVDLDLKKPKAAIANLQRVLRVSENYPLVHYYMGRAYLLMNDPQGAIDQAKEERKKNPNLADSYILAATAYTQMKQYSLCAQEYEKAIQLRPQGAMIYVDLAICHRFAGNLEIAKTMLTQAKSKESGLPIIYKELGLIYESLGQKREALEAYKYYLVLEPNAPDRSSVEGRMSRL